MPISVSDLETLQQGYLDALVEDSVSPKPDYSIDGQTVSRATWRDSLLRKIGEIQELLPKIQPFELRGITT